MRIYEGGMKLYPEGRSNMRYSSKRAVEYDLEKHYQMADRYNDELSARSQYKNSYIKLTKKTSEKRFYSVRKGTDKAFRYVGADEDSDLIAIREYKFYEEGLKIINSNIRAMEDFLSIYKNTGAENINELLTKAYRLPHNSALLQLEPEIDAWLNKMSREKARYPLFDEAGLTVTAFDGTKLRSRAEAFHYEAFYIYGIPAIFEYPYEIGEDILRPDFTTLDVHLIKPVIWEHLGYWFHSNIQKRERYRADNIHRIDQYSQIGFLPESNLILTFGSSDNRFDVQSIHRKIAMMASPPPSKEILDMLKHI